MWYLQRHCEECIARRGNLPIIKVRLPRLYAPRNDASRFTTL